MKKVVLFLLVLTVFVACNNTNDQNAEQDNPEQVSDNLAAENTDKIDETNENSASSSVILGTWTGEMSNKKLTIVIEKVNGTELEGYNILGSNKRGLKGTFTEGEWDIPCSKAYQATLNEPGDDKWDGVFTIKFVGYEDEEETEEGPECIGNLKGVEAMGEWQSNKTKKKKSFQLVKEK